ncbi:MAG: BMP family ABC transporter substrate-binding protein, partial [Mesorhizobium sp.]
KKVLEVENVPYSADATRIYRQFVSEGANLIFDTSSTGDFLHEVVKRAPDVGFMECDGRTTMDNLGWYYLNHWYPTYVVGVAAGHLSKSGKLGYVASFPVPSVFSGTNAFLMGARSVNPNATLQAVVINSWFDPQAAAQAGT